MVRISLLGFMKNCSGESEVVLGDLNLKLDEIQVNVVLAIREFLE